MHASSISMNKRIFNFDNFLYSEGTEFDLLLWRIVQFLNISNSDQPFSSYALRVYTATVVVLCKKDDVELSLDFVKH